MTTSRRRDPWFERAGTPVAVGVAVLGVVYTAWLVPVAIAIWVGSRYATARRHASPTSSLAGIPVREAMRCTGAIAADAPLGEAACRLVQTGQHELPIVDHGEPIGVLTRTDVAAGINDVGPQAPIARAPHHVAITVAPQAPLDGVVDRLAHAPNAIAVVVENGAVLGVVTPQQLATFVELHGPHPTLSR